MAFPASPVNGQQTVVNNITYQYVAARHSWVRVLSGQNTFTVNNLVANGNVSAAAFYWANGQPFASSSFGNTDVAGYLAPYYTYANANAATQAGYISTLQTQVYSNVNTAAYLTGNITVGNIRTDGYYYANGTPYGITVFDDGIPVANAITGINFVGTAVTATADGANVSVVITGGGGGGGGAYTAATTPPAVGNNPGDKWYNTSTDTLYEYVYDGTSYYWVDITTPVTGNVSTGYVNRKYTATGTGNTYAISTGCTVFNVMVYLNGVAQMPTDDYTISGTTLTVDGTPDAGTIVQIRELPR